MNTTHTQRKGLGWPIVVLAMAEALIILDLSFGSIAIEAVNRDLGGSIAQLQMIIAVYALIVAGFTLTGGNLGDNWGRRRVFRIGLIIRLVGAALTALAPNIWVYGVGEAVFAGIGMALISPAISSLAASIYSGRDAAKAFGTIGAYIAVAGGVGPVLGGWIVTNMSWRWCNWLEFAITLAILIGSTTVPDVASENGHRPLDRFGAVLTAIGFGAIVIGIQQALEWGWFLDDGSPISVMGLSLVPVLVLGGVALLIWFVFVERRRSAMGKPVLVDMKLFARGGPRPVFVTTFGSQAALAGILFVIPVYLQVVEEKSAFESGIYLIPMAITAFLASAIWPRLARIASPRSIGIFAGCTTIACAALIYWDISPSLAGDPILIAVALFGIGTGILDSQLDAVAQAVTPEEFRSEVAGLQCTADNFGSAIGVALVGTVLLIGLSTGAATLLRENPSISETGRAEANVIVENNLPMLSVGEASAWLEANPATASDAPALVSIYRHAQSDALSTAILVCGALTFVTIAAASRLPRRRLEELEPATLDEQSV